MPPSALDVLRLAGGALLLLLPGLLLVHPVLPGRVARAAAGFVVGCALVSAVLWLLAGPLARPMRPATAWLAYAAALALAAAGMLLLRLRRARVVHEPPAARAPRLARGDVLSWRALGLAAPVLLAFVLALKPRVGHWLPYHTDEWWHLSVARAYERQGTLAIVEPTYGLFPLAQDAAVLYHVHVASLRLLTGVDWLALATLLPALTFACTTAAAWACGDRWGYGWSAALLVALLPTSIRLLGPHLLVPLALGLATIPVAYLLFVSSRRGVALVGLLVAWLFFVHPQSSAAAGILVGTYGVLTMRRSPWRSVALLLLAVLPLALGLAFQAERLQADDLVGQTTRLSVPDFLSLLGILPALLFLGGTALTLAEGEPDRLAWSATTAAHLALVALYLLFGLGQPNLYDRAWMHALLTISMTGGYALARLADAARRHHAHAPRIVAVLVAAALLATAAPAQAAREDDYVVYVTPEQHESLAWIRDNVPADGARALVHPMQGTAFAALTGIPVASALPYHGGPVPPNATRNLPGWGTAQRVLDEGARDERVLQRANVTLVWTDPPVVNANYTEWHPNVWVRVNVTR